MPARDETTSPNAGLPWAFVLDPAANAAALSEVQRRGLDAARRLVDRAIARSDRSTNGGPPESNGQRRPGEDPHQREPLAELIRCWTELTAQVLAKLAEDGERSGPAGTDHDQSTAMPVDGSGRCGSVRLCLNDDMQGRLHAASEILLSNPSDRPVGPLDLRVDDLHTPDGNELVGSCVHFDPPVIDELAPGSTHVVGVTVSTDRRLAPGSYRGIVQSVGAPAFSLALQVDVRPSEP